MATKDRTALKDEFKNGNLATGERFADLIDSMKVVQLPVVDPQALGTSLSFIDSISQDADGKITVTKKRMSPTVGSFQFVANDATAEAAFTAVGAKYSGAISGVSPSADTLGVILLMNDDDTTPTKTMMITTEEVTPATNPATYQFVYVGDLQSALTSGVLTVADIVNGFTGGVDKVLSAEAGKVLNQKIFSEFHEIGGNVTTAMSYQDIAQIPLVAGRTYKFKVERDNSETETRFIYIKDSSFVEGSSSSGSILVYLTMNESEHLKEITYVPSISQIGHLTCNLANKSFVFNCKIYIDETDLNENIIDNIDGYVNEQTSQIKSLSELQKYDGWIDSSNRIISHTGCKYVVIPVKNGDVISKAASTEEFFVIVKEFTYNPTLPYTLVFATGESGRRNGVTNLTMPSDAKYILLMVTQYNGTSNLPSSMTINGVDITKSLEERLNSQINAVSTRVSVIENFDAGLDDDIIDNDFEGTRTKEESMIDYFDGDDVTYRGVTVECNSDGTFVFSGTATSSGGGQRYSNKFTLDAGTYIGKIIKTDVGLPDVRLLNYNDLQSIQAFSRDWEFTLSETKECCIGFSVINGTTYSGTITFVIIKRVLYPVERTAYDGKARNALSSAGLLDNFIVKEDVARVINIPDITPLAGQGMCVIREDLVYGGIFNKSSNQKESQIHYNNTWKWAGIAAHCNDLDYCEYTDTLITATLIEDASPLGLYLLQGAYNKLYVDSGNLAENDWTFVSLGNDWSTYDIVGNCFGESCDIVYCFVKAPGGETEDDYLLKVRLEMSDGAYTGNCTIVWSKKWGNVVEIQGSKFCNGKLYVSIDKYVSSSVEYAGIAVIDVATMKTIQYPMYANNAEKIQRVEGEGLAFIGDKGYHIVMNHTNNDTLYIREFERFGL